MRSPTAYRILLAAWLICPLTARADSSPSTRATTPLDAVRDWWMTGKNLPPVGSPKARRIADYYASHPDDAEVQNWIAVAQSKGLIRTNRSTFDLIREAAEHGCSSAQAQLGLAYLTGGATPAHSDARPGTHPDRV